MANINGSVGTNSSKYSYYITWSESAIDSTTNTSLVTATVYVKKVSDYNAEGYGGTHHLYINGVHFTDNNYIDMNPETTARVVVSGSTTITHNTDGSKSITISSNGDLPDGYYSGVYYGPRTGSASGTAVLAVVPRGAVITSTSLNFTVGNTIPVTFTNPANYYVKAFLLAPDASEVSATAFGQVTSGTIPATTGMYAKITTALTGICTVRLKTYSDAGYTTQIGVDSDKTCTATIDSATNRPTFPVAPTLSSVAKTVYVTDTYNDVPFSTTIAALTNSISTVAIRYYSSIMATITTLATGKNSATIAEYIYENLPLHTHVTSTGSPVSATVDPVSSSVNTITAVDSRGLTSTQTPTFSVFSEYSPISSLNWALTVKRGSNVDAATTITLAGSYWQKYFDTNVKASGTGVLNTVIGQYRYKESTATDWSVNGGTVTVTIAVPGRFNKVAHGLITGDQVWLTTTGALPTGLTAGTHYYIIKDTDDYFWVSTSYENAVASTKVTTTGSQSGIHTMFSYVKWNTLTLTNPGDDQFAHNATVNGDLGASGFTTTKAFDIQVRVYDKLSVAIVEKRLSVGKPLMHVSKYGVGIGKLHASDTTNTLEVDGNILLTNDLPNIFTARSIVSGASNGIVMATARGSILSPTATQSNDDLVVLKAAGYGTTGWTGSKASLIIEAAQAWTDSVFGNRFLLNLCPVDGASAQEVFRVSDFGHPAHATSSKRYSASTATRTSNTALLDIDNLSVFVAAATTYKFWAELYCTANAAGGVRVAVSGTATATAIVYQVVCNSGTSTSTTRATALDTVGGITAADPFIRVFGTITVNAAGTLKLQFAQNVSNGTASTVVIGSTFRVEELRN